MIYIVIALKSEAQAFVDKFKLIKTKYNKFSLYIGKEIVILVSGMGIENTKIGTTVLIEKFNPSDNDILMNIGICAANKKYEIGELLKIGSIYFEDEKYLLDENIPNTITCSNNEVSQSIYELVDMESFGFYKASQNIKNRSIYKVVSDHFEPNKITKDSAKKLIFNKIDTIIREVKS